MDADYAFQAWDCSMSATAPQVGFALTSSTAYDAVTYNWDVQHGTDQSDDHVYSLEAATILVFNSFNLICGEELLSVVDTLDGETVYWQGSCPRYTPFALRVPTKEVSVVYSLPHFNYTGTEPVKSDRYVWVGMNR